jgi:hypothetical protein
MWIKLYNNKLYIVGLLTLSLISLICNFIAFSGTFISNYFIPLYFILLFSFCYFTYKELDYSVLVRLQIFYIVPFLINFIFIKEPKFVSYLLEFIIFTISNMICFYAVMSTNIVWRYSHKALFYILAGIMIVVCIAAVCFVFRDAVRSVILFNILAVYALIAKAKNRIPISANVEADNTKKIFVYSSFVIASYVADAFWNNLNFLFYVLYLTSAINLCFCSRNDKWYFVLTIAILYLASFIPISIAEQYINHLILTIIVLLFHVRSPVVYARDTKYGFLKVEYNYRAHKITLLNDNIYHGERSLKESGYINTPYYGHFKGGPVVTVFNLLAEQKNSKIAVLGLGAGIMASFAKANQELTFYEINPEIIKIAQNKNFFDYLYNSKAKVNIIKGDARAKLNEVQNQYYDLLCVDVYLGRNIPKHFLTLEAMQLYLKKLSNTGILLLHITNRDNDFESLIAKMVIELGAHGYSYYQSSITGKNIRKKGLFSEEYKKAVFKTKLFDYLADLLKVDFSNLINEEEEEVFSWVAISQNEESIAELANSRKWHKLYLDQEQEIYTDKIIGYRYSGVITREIE